jgi:transcriptional regulator with XRE-family HTH domain
MGHAVCIPSIAIVRGGAGVHDSAPKDDHAAALAAAIGRRVRLERQQRGWTLDHLAETAGVSRRMLINVEQGAANPSVGTLLKISDALGIGLPALVELPQRTPVKVTRRDEGATLWTGEHGGRGVLVAGNSPPEVVELWEWTMQPGDRHVSEAHTPGTWELLHVLDGAIVLVIGDDWTHLHTGDAASFPGDVAHSYENAGEEAARFTMCVFEPGVGTGAH